MRRVLCLLGLLAANVVGGPGVLPGDFQDKFNHMMPPPRQVSRPPTTSPTTGPEFESGELTGCDNGDTAVDVDGADGRFCVDKLYHCGREVPQGPCPPPQDGLPFGSYCAVTSTGLIKCVAKVNGQVVVPVMYIPDPAPKVPVTPHPTVTKSFEDGQLSECGDELSPIAVLLVDGANETFCIDASFACSNFLPDGPCPPPQPGLPKGSACRQLDSQVFGCVERTV
ncbi:hypothetical protein H310_04392 [Aphanomyces invadans]|uniref:Uncharacterized protein n=1 Tax=Aphanomyces invadans TaxID=157072 RepID=A0A024UCQ9_9STRA|nr:hypothetical protein H310_04392 [Aphanomyces invadans]ETW03985.1 hypothetical protein H310_04392 [Aphanomyces invadans]|eukprot:XP_008866941.1 hypothetical protein H310_04392 [Aphanomyces invadans]